MEARARCIEVFDNAEPESSSDDDSTGARPPPPWISASSGEFWVVLSGEPDLHRKEIGTDCNQGTTDHAAKQRNAGHLDSTRRSDEPMVQSLRDATLKAAADSGFLQM